GADAAPSPDARQGLATTRAFVEAVERAWKTVVERELPQLDRRLQAAGAPAIGLSAKLKG
ncbi:MAG: hypothetical protein ABIV06_15045, partial [Thermoanaerobaculia bacterium]